MRLNFVDSSEIMYPKAEKRQSIIIICYCEVSILLSGVVKEGSVVWDQTMT